MKVYYDDSLDGRLAAYYLYQEAGRLCSRSDIKQADVAFAAVGDRLRFPMDKIGPGEQVFLLGVSLKPEKMNELLQITDEVVWFEHEVAIIDEYQVFPWNLQGVRFCAVSACVLTHVWLHQMVDAKGQQVKAFPQCNANDVPIVARFVSTFTKSGQFPPLAAGMPSAYFALGTECEDTEPHTEFWAKCHRDKAVIQRIVTQGALIEKYEKAQKAKVKEDVKQLLQCLSAALDSGGCLDSEDLGGIAYIADKHGLMRLPESVAE